MFVLYNFCVQSVQVNLCSMPELICLLNLQRSSDHFGLDDDFGDKRVGHVDKFGLYLGDLVSILKTLPLFSNKKSVMSVCVEPTK